MTVKTISRNLPLVDAEMRALRALINKREEWLNNPINRSKSTFKAVKADTDEMRSKLADLTAEKESLLNPNK